MAWHRLLFRTKAAGNKKESGNELPHSKDWPHSPLHRLGGKGTYIVTAGTLKKEHFFRDAELLDLLENQLLGKAKQYGWQLEAWAVFSNHYHFVGHALQDSATLKPFLTHLHADTAREVNLRDNEPERQVWFNYWETELTFEKSYFARLNYVHQNPVKHGLVPVANQYPWCSAAWFENGPTRSGQDDLQFQDGPDPRGGRFRRPWSAMTCHRFLFA